MSTPTARGLAGRVSWVAVAAALLVVATIVLAALGVSLELVVALGSASLSASVLSLREV